MSTSRRASERRRKGPPCQRWYAGSWRSTQRGADTARGSSCNAFLRGKRLLQLHTLYAAPTRAECSQLRAELCQRLRLQGQADAAACLERDWEDFVAFYDFPEEHWTHLRTSNPIESIFAGVRLRTNAAKRMRVRENALYLVFKLVTRLSLNWRAINGPNQLLLLIAGGRFVDGKLRRQPNTEGLAA
jgi:hypothetical protein